MRIRNWSAWLAFTLVSSLVVAATKTAKPPAGGVKTPGVLIPVASLKADATFALASPASGAHFTANAVMIADTIAIRRFDGKTNKAFEPSRDVTEVVGACGGMVAAFGHLWTTTCGSTNASLAKVELPAPPPGGGGGVGRNPGGGPPTAPPAKSAAGAPDMPKPEAESAKPVEPPPAAPKPEPGKPVDPPKPPKPPVFTPLETGPSARSALAASGDSLWLLADGKTSLQRIDPQTNLIVAEVRLPRSCESILFAEGALWVACPSEARVLRVDPTTNLVEKRIEVSAEPIAIAVGDSSIWVLSRKEGKIARLDPKTNKVTATIELGVANADGSLAFGDGFLWASSPGFPVMRIAPAIDKVVQQFHGEGGGWIAFGSGSLWVGSAKSNTVARFDPKRVQATLAE